MRESKHRFILQWYSTYIRKVDKRNIETSLTTFIGFIDAENLVKLIILLWRKYKGRLFKKNWNKDREASETVRKREQEIVRKKEETDKRNIETFLITFNNFSLILLTHRT